MKRLLAPAVSIFFLAAAAQAAPRLLVVVAVDQMRADYVESGTIARVAGLKRLAAEGFLFAEAHHVHIPTETGPGHAAILTGRFPGTHGIIGNDWYDRTLATDTYCVDDAVHGIGPQNLWSYTVGDALKAHDPKSRVVSVSLKDRAAVLLGGKKPDMALWYSRAKGAFATSSYYGGEPWWLEGFNSRLKARGGALEGASKERYTEIIRTPDADRMVLALALEAAKRYQLGRDGHPDILAVSFSATDYIGHRYGPDSPQMREQLSRLDQTLADLLSGLDALIGQGRFDLILTADHGVYPLPAAGLPTVSKRLLWDDLTLELEKALQKEFPAKGPWVLSNQFPNIFLDLAQAARGGLDRGVFLRRAARRVATVEGVAAAYIPEALDAADPYYETYRRSVAVGRSGDLVLRPSRDVLIVDPEDLDTHGSPYEYDTHVPLLFWGPDFAAGRSSETVRILDLAPTAAAVLGVEFLPEPDSRVLLRPAGR